MNSKQIEASNLTKQINDLEPQQAEEIKGGQTREHILLARQTQSAKKKKGLSGDYNGDGTVSGSDF